MKNLQNIIKIDKKKIFIEKVIKMFETKGDEFITLNYRPKFSKKINTAPDEKSKEKIGIVIQGPLIKKDNFTLQTIQLYKRIFENDIIILSTWEDEDPEYLKTIEKEEVLILLNKKPEYAGASNINFQIISAREGVNRAKKEGCEYILKTRTDARIYDSNSKKYLLNVINGFPLNEKSIQKKRLVGLSFNTFKYRPYSVSDVTLFGTCEDMVLYWNAPIDERKMVEKDLEDASKSIGAYIKYRFSEMYLVTEFLKKIGRKYDFTLGDAWKVYAENFIIVDKVSVDFFFPKYTNKEDRWRSYDNRTSMELNFKEWFNLYMNIDRLDVPEKILELKFGDVIPEEYYR